jgi:hypothetical protein
LDKLGKPKRRLAPAPLQVTGRELTDENVWIHECRREVASLDAIIERLRTDTAVSEKGNSVGGAGTATACR